VAAIDGLPALLPQPVRHGGPEAALAGHRDCVLEVLVLRVTAAALLITCYGSRRQQGRLRDNCGRGRGGRRYCGCGGDRGGGLHGGPALSCRAVEGAVLLLVAWSQS
jgi:hypothetical protein